MIPPSFDFTSELFDARKVLRSNRVILPYPKAKVYNNIAEYYSHTFLKKEIEALKSKIKVQPRERNYDWYYDTLGLTESVRNYIRSTKKVQKRKGKKPVPVVTIPCSPQKSKKVTICESGFKDYCRRKYRSLNMLPSTKDSESKECENLPSNTTSDIIWYILYGMRSVIKTEPVDSASELPTIKLKASEISPKLLDSTKTESPFLLCHTVKSEPPIVSSASCVVSGELSDSSNDSFTDDVLIFKMKSNVQKNCALKNNGNFPVSFPTRREPQELSSKGKYVNGDSQYFHGSYQTSYNKKPSQVSKAISSNKGHPLNFGSYVKNYSENIPSRMGNSNASANNRKKGDKKHNKANDHELILEKGLKTPKHNKKQKLDKNKEKNSNVLDGSLSSKSTHKNISNKKKSVLHNENGSLIDSKSNIQSIKKRQAALKSQENVLHRKKVSVATEVDSKVNNIASKTKIESSSVINQCTCKFPCGLTHLCTCGFFASAKEGLSKFKIPRKKKKVNGDIC